MRVERWRDDVVPVSPSTVEFYRSSGAWAGLTIAHQFHRSAQVHGDSPAVITEEGTFSYRWVDEQTDRIAAGLAERGLDLGEAVLLQVENTVETVLAWYGIIKAGLVPVATLAAHRRREIESIASIVDAAAHVVAADYAKFDLVGFAEDLAARAGGGRQVFTLRGDARAGAAARLEDVGAHIAPERARQVVESIQARIDGDDVAVFQLSGGTTAEPKVIPRLHDDYWCNGLAYARRLGWDSSTRVAHILPLVHNAGIACAMHPAHAVGGALVLTDADPDRLLALFAESGTTDVMTFPAIA